MRCFTATILLVFALLPFAAPMQAQQPGDIVITEVLVNPGGTISDANGEWFELHNNTHFAIDLKDWFVQDSAASGLRPMHKIATSLVVPAHGFVVLGNTTNTTNNGGVPVDYAYGAALTLANSLDAIRIIAPDSATIIDRVKYASAVVSAQNGVSRELKDVTLHNHNMDGANWVDAVPEAVYGPGGRGTPCVAGQTTGMLPVELVSFRVVADGQGAALTWETASETNNAGFEVEYRAGSGAFRSVGFVVGRGTTAETSRYHHTLEGLAAGTHVFRLRQVDFDGAFEYSPEVELSIEADGLALTLHTNPARDEIRGSVFLPDGQRARVVLYDGVGRRVLTQEDVAGAFSLNVTALSSGSYVLRLETGQQAVTRRIVVLR